MSIKLLNKYNPSSLRQLNIFFLSLAYHNEQERGTKPPPYLDQYFPYFLNKNLAQGIEEGYKGDNLPSSYTILAFIQYFFHPPPFQLKTLIRFFNQNLLRRTESF